MDDEKRDLPYPYNQDFSGILRGQLPNSRVTAAVMCAVVQLVQRNLGPGAEQARTDPDDWSLLGFLTRQDVVDEVNANVGFGCHTTVNALRYRWPRWADFYADIFRFGQTEWHFPGAHQDEIADATEQIIHGDDPVRAIQALCGWDVRRRLSTPMSWLGLLAAARAQGEPVIRAAIAEHHRENEASWKLYCEEFLKARRLRLRPGITLDDCVTLLTALADGLTMRAITETGPAAGQVSGRERSRCLLGTGALALIASCAEPEDEADGRSLKESATAIMTRNGNTS